MTVAQTTREPNLISRLVNGLLSIKPLWNVAKYQARQMMITRAEKIGVPWRDNVKQLQAYPNWSELLSQVENSALTYPDYYLTSFHAYDQGNLCWEAALEVESAAKAVHSTIWQDTDGINVGGDAKIRKNYHNVLKAQLEVEPQQIIDLGCSAGLSTFPLQETYPDAQITGIDLSPYCLAVAQYHNQERNKNINWLNAAAEATGLPSNSVDLVSAFLVFHELPQSAAKAIFAEARRLLRKGGYFTMMDMNPRSEVYQKMPPYVLTLLKSTEPYLDQYFTLDIVTALEEAGFEKPTITPISPRHRAIIAKVQ
ncbi:MAG: class I SAM-dependent methyltransferase [Microcystaceae cyanobacterium]